MSILSYDEKKSAAMSHSLSLIGRSKLSIDGVVDVSGFDENTVLLNTSQGLLTVRGEGLHVDRIDLELGQLEVQGQVSQLSYDELAPNHSIWSRLFG